MQIKKAKFLISAPNLKLCPPTTMPEIAFLGRSNVGKSSFINSICNIKNLAKTSSAPGKTRLINFFEINEAFMFVDLPGYGYAKVSAKIQQEWQKNLEDYLLNREQLKCLILLIDARHDLQKNDLQMIEWLNFYKLNYKVIATKADCYSKSKLQSHLKDLSKKTGCSVYPFSAVDKRYSPEIFKLLDGILELNNQM